MQIIRVFGLRKFEWVLFKVETVPPPDLSDLTVEEIGPGESPDPDQGAFLRRHISAISLARLLRWHRRRTGWAFLARREGRYAFYVFVTPGLRRQRAFPVISEQKSLLLGPAFTEPDFRGRGI